MKGTTMIDKQPRFSFVKAFARVSGFVACSWLLGMGLMGFVVLAYRVAVRLVSLMVGP
jgi:hypothetical protein